jgi:hypothetical protein
MSEQIGIQYGPLTQAIYAGRISKDQAYFLDKQEMTDEAVLAVAQMVAEKYDGEVTMSTPNISIEIKVVRTDSK